MTTRSESKRLCGCSASVTERVEAASCSSRSRADGPSARGSRPWPRSDRPKRFGTVSGTVPVRGLSLRRPDLKLADDLFGLLAREGAKCLRVLGPVPLELQDDLGRCFVVRRLEDLDHVVAAERDVNADEAAAGLADDPLAVLDTLAPGRQARDTLRGPAHQRHVVRHGPDDDGLCADVLGFVDA